MNKFIAIIAAALVASVSFALELQPLDTQGRATYNATHQAILDFGDFSDTTTTNTSLSITQAVPAKVGMALVGMVLEKPFDGSGVSTAITQSVSLKIGDGSDDDLYLTATEMASDSSEVFIKYAPLGSVTIAATGVVTAVSSLGVKYYSTAGDIVYTITPAAQHSLSAQTEGRVKLFWHELK